MYIKIGLKLIKCTNYSHPLFTRSLLCPVIIENENCKTKKKTVSLIYLFFLQGHDH